MSDFYCHHDLSDDPECVEQCGRCWEIQRLSAENSRLSAKTEIDQITMDNFLGQLKQKDAENSRQSCEGERWKDLCASMLIHVEPGAGRRRAESYEAEYNALVSTGKRTGAK
ncbi:hypothetical protein LCGC14_2924730 [marine sediment metagenome]|uniref:Uncharacterized protein n=1 Tax=marine sediment metagenome TaxID=412755 RepID=A0A0F8Y9L5_9ZZZZ